MVKVKSEVKVEYRGQTCKEIPIFERIKVEYKPLTLCDLLHDFIS